jgi:hypothetical protein
MSVTILNRSMSDNLISPLQCCRSGRLLSGSGSRTNFSNCLGLDPICKCSRNFFQLKIFFSIHKTLQHQKVNNISILVASDPEPRTVPNIRIRSKRFWSDRIRNTALYVWCLYTVQYIKNSWKRIFSTVANINMLTFVKFGKNFTFNLYPEMMYSNEALALRIWKSFFIFF